MKNQPSMAMQLKDVEQLLSKEPTGQHGAPQSCLDAVAQLKIASDKALDYLRHNNSVLAQVYLEQCFSLLIQSFHYLDIQLEQVVQREVQRSQGQTHPLHERVILVFSDHAELRVNGELRGTFPLYNEADYSEIHQISQLFDCRIEHADHVQLTLFETLNAPN